MRGYRGTRFSGGRPNRPFRCFWFNPPTGAPRGPVGETGREALRKCEPGGYGRGGLRGDLRRRDGLLGNAEAEPRGVPAISRRSAVRPALGRHARLPAAAAQLCLLSCSALVVG